MQFTDLNDKFNGPHIYNVTNEEPEVINRKLLAGSTYGKIGSIASSGDVVILCLLHRVREQLFAVDHSYGSLYCAYEKALLLRELGAKKLTGIVEANNQAGYNAAVRLLQAKIPEKIRGKASTSYNLSGIRKEWFYTGQAAVIRSRRNLDKLHFVHGDLTDLIPYGPLDLLYISNAQEHTDKTGRCPSLNKIGSSLAIGGHLLVASNQATPYYTGTEQDFAANFKILKKVAGYRTGYTYFLIERIA